MGVVDLVQDLESPDPSIRFKAATSLYQLGPRALPAIPKLVGLLRDIDGMNVADPATGEERMVTIAERASLALAAIGEVSVNAVTEELKKDNPASAIHCVRALASPLLARRAPVAILAERLMRPKVSPNMCSALCDVLVAACQSPDEVIRNAAKSALQAANGANRVTAKYKGLFAQPGATPVPPPAATPIPAPVQGERPMRRDSPTSIQMPAKLPPPEPEPAAPDPPSRTITRPELSQRTDRPVQVAEPTAEYQPEFVLDPPRKPASAASSRVDEALARPSGLSSRAPEPAPTTYEAGDRFKYRQDVSDLLKRGEKLKAVHLLREKTGASLVEALKQIEAWKA